MDAINKTERLCATLTLKRTNLIKRTEYSVGTGRRTAVIDDAYDLESLEDMQALFSFIAREACRSTGYDMARAEGILEGCLEKSIQAIRDELPFA